MKNLAHYKGECLAVHKQATAQKRDVNLKNRLDSILPIIESEYNLFSSRFDENQLTLLSSNPALLSSKIELESLYNYKSSVIKTVRENILSLQPRTVTSTCQNCTIDTVNTLDHILPKSKFPQFDVNPKNLFPCCPTCNSFKVDSMSKNSSQLFLNLYLDELPEYQYLFLNIYLDEYQDINFEFYLKNIDNKINPNLFSTIENHFKKLHLFERMKKKSIEHLTELEIKIESFLNCMPLDDIKVILIESAEKFKVCYGANHWQAILEIGLLNSPIFMNRFEAKKNHNPQLF